MSETFFTPEILRMLERIIIVAGGICSIFLGYRLFDKVSARARSSGSLKAFIGSVDLIGVAPGVFFALFGAGVLVYSLASPVKITQSAQSEAEFEALKELVQLIPDIEKRKKAERIVYSLSRVSSFMAGNPRRDSQHDM